MHWNFLKILLQANITTPVLGADFLAHFNLSVNMATWSLFDNQTELSITGICPSHSCMGISTALSVDNTIKLGHQIDETGIVPITEKVEVIQNIEQTTLLRQLRCFIALINNYYWWFICQCFSILLPMTDLLKNWMKKNVKMALLGQALKAFNNSKSALSNFTWGGGEGGTNISKMITTLKLGSWLICFLKCVWSRYLSDSGSRSSTNFVFLC